MPPKIPRMIARAVCVPADRAATRIATLSVGSWVSLAVLDAIGSSQVTSPHFVWDMSDLVKVLEVWETTQSRGRFTMPQFQLSGVSVNNIEYKGRSAVEVTMPSSAFQNPEKEQLTDRAFMAWRDIDFRDGTIEANVASVIAPDALPYARGFIGLAFRIDATPKFEGIYLRPANSRVEDQVRRNHSVQYFAYPDFDFARLRTEEPERYESYVDIALEEWIQLKIEVRRSQAKLYVNRSLHPSLIVSDMKLGSEQRGGVGFWIESGTIGYFADLKITLQDAS